MTDQELADLRHRTAVAKTAWQDAEATLRAANKAATEAWQAYDPLAKQLEREEAHRAWREQYERDLAGAGMPARGAAFLAEKLLGPGGKEDAS